MPRAKTPRTRDRSEPDLTSWRRRVLRWYRAHSRVLPWRRTRDPYRIWISEIMLQQTRVDVVTPFYERFVARFPDVVALADARLEEVLQAWSGLGYYTRARNLHAAARHVRDDRGGRLPDAPRALLALPGIGRYTAGAILSIAFGRPEPILDGNVVRVFSRLLAIDADVDSTPVRRRLWELAARWAESSAPGDANQALMELGATLCTRRAPACGVCPLRRDCRARLQGRELALPRPRRRPGDAVHLAAALLRRRARLLLVRRCSGRLLQDWWEVPTCRCAERPPSTRKQVSRIQDASSARLVRTLRTRLGVEPRDLRRKGSVQHGIMNHRLQVDILAGTRCTAAKPRATRSQPARKASRARVTPSSPRPAPWGSPLANLELDDLELRWVSAAECRELPLSTLARKVLRAAARSDAVWGEFLDGCEAGTPTSDANEAAGPR